ncbi:MULTISPECIES: hypothetical protein [Carboxydothermus]|uniref:Small-conductance mechanosensitive channel n=2 Tax=Carboxydothermus TaxID=129957 RepID=A0ABX2RFI2_9THEO|nr:MULTISPECIES: hypothetical protein [Carboxydothermus]ABB16012.1 putative membrane protein [Carboxydothermus hydrogenoformans Z-2901]NYE58813.1 small-conductance mechanosensitive channel [Carboxydothermus ferrireducens DSM 11255]
MFDIFKVVLKRMAIAFISWGVGLLLIVGYSFLMYYLYRNYSLWHMLSGAVLFWVILYFIIDFWGLFIGFDESITNEQK